MMIYTCRNPSPKQSSGSVDDLSLLFFLGRNVVPGFQVDMFVLPRMGTHQFSSVNIVYFNFKGLQVLETSPFFWGCKVSFF